MLTQTRIVCICLFICLLMAAFWFLYETWGRQAVDWGISLFVNYDSCQLGQNSECDEAIKTSYFAHAIGYILFSLCTYLPASFIATKLLTKNKTIQLTASLFVAATVFATPIFSSYFANTVSISSAFFHFLLLLAGFAGACIWRRTYAT